MSPQTQSKISVRLRSRRIDIKTPLPNHDSHFLARLRALLNRSAKDPFSEHNRKFHVQNTRTLLAAVRPRKRFVFSEQEDSLNESKG